MILPVASVLVRLVPRDARELCTGPAQSLQPRLELCFNVDVPRRIPWGSHMQNKHASRSANCISPSSIFSKALCSERGGNATGYPCHAGEDAAQVAFKLPRLRTEYRTALAESCCSVLLASKL